jgi:hypothetical protein
LVYHWSGYDDYEWCSAVLWNFFKQDFQGAFGFAGWIIAAVAFVNGIFAVYIAK